MLLGLTEFTKVYIQIKDNPWPYVNFVKLVQNSGMRDVEVAELLKIANGYLPRVRLEYDRCKADLNSLKADICNSVLTYQDFCNRNLEMNKRINELRLIVDELEAKRSELQKPKLNEALPECHDNSDKKDVNFEVQQEDVISTNDALIPPLNAENDCRKNENETCHYPFQVEPSFRTVIFDTKDLF